MKEENKRSIFKMWYFWVLFVLNLLVDLDTIVELSAAGRIGAVLGDFIIALLLSLLIRFLVRLVKKIVNKIRKKD